jgi:thiaminase/transcriptional activator TenA
VASSTFAVCFLASLFGEGAAAFKIQRADCPAGAEKSSGLVSWTHASMVGAPISSLLLQQSIPTALRCLYHPFVYGIAAGKLPLASFKNYVGQDAFFLNAFADAYKKAGALASLKGDISGQKEFKVLEDGVTDELNLHKAYAEKWKVDLSAVQPNPVTAAYCGYVADIAAGGDGNGGGGGEGAAKISHVCSALAPCMRLYAYLGQTLAKAGYAQVCSLQGFLYS